MWCFNLTVPVKHAGAKYQKECRNPNPNFCDSFGPFDPIYFSITEFNCYCNILIYISTDMQV